MNDNKNQEYDEISIIEIINILLKSKALIIILLCIGLALGLCYSFYQNSKILPVSESTIELVSSTKEKINTEKHQLVMKCSLIENLVKEDLDVDSIGNVSVSVSKLGLYTISVTTADADLANKVNESLISNYESYLEVDYQERYETAKMNVVNSVDELEKLMEDSQQEIDDLTNILDTIIIDESLDIEYHVSNNRDLLMYSLLSKIYNTEKITVNVISEPSVSISTVGYKKNIAIGMVVGLLFGFVLAFIREWWRNNKSS